MDKITGKLTVYFEDPFWVGIFETASGRYMKAARVVFGGEPRDGEIYEYILNKYASLKFSPVVESTVCEKKVNPKRRQREARAELLKNGVGTKSQQALKQMQELGKMSRKMLLKERKLEKKEHDFELKRQKKKEKHRH